MMGAMLLAALFASSLADDGACKFTLAIESQTHKPPECSEANKVKVGDKVGMKYMGSIASCSTAGKPGTVFDRSGLHGDGIFRFTVGRGEVE